jgi:hypothetical protein
MVELKKEVGRAAKCTGYSVLLATAFIPELKTT